MTAPLAVVGDIHGNLPALDGMLSRLAMRSEQAQIIFTGDYVNRGSNSAGVVNRLVELKIARPTTVFVRGNHDEAFLDALATGSLNRLLRMGGAPTIASYVGRPRAELAEQFQAAVPLSHLRFFQSLVPFWSSGDVTVTHSRDGDRLGGQQEVIRVFGHSPTASRRPTIDREGRWAAIDTGCGTFPDGRLSALLLPTFDTIQVDNYGDGVS